MELAHYLIAIALVGVLSLYFMSTTCEEPGGCPRDLKACYDGTLVGRNLERGCEFDPCPKVQYCDALNPCPEGKDCYLFPGEEVPFCYTGDPCMKCESFRCLVMESYPMMVRCE